MSETFAEVLGILKTGVSAAIQDLEHYQEGEPSPRLENAIEELKSNGQFLEQVDGWLETMPAERLREVLQSSIEALRSSFQALIESGEVQTVEGEEGRGDTIPPFLNEAAERLGPRLFVREDKMRASVQIDAKDRETWSAEKVEGFLEQEGIVHGVDTEAIRKIFEEERFDRAVRVATGTNPVPGENGRIQYTFDLEAISGRPTTLESGRVDHKELNLFYYVSPGHLLAELAPPTPGIAGSNVYGEEIPTEDGIPAELIAGENTAISENGTQLTAQVEGNLALDGTVVSVKPSVLIPGDVSYSTGNINSPVGVTVQGNVLSGFRVYSKDSINIGGLVEAAKIISEADIAVNGGVEGKGKGYLEAQGDIRVQFLNDVRAQCDRSLYTTGIIFHSVIWAGESVFAEGNHGQIAEGGVRAEDEVQAEEIGSEMGVRTKIELGVATLAMPGRIEELQNRLAELEEKKARFAKAAEKLARLKKARGGLDANKEKTLKKAITVARKYKELVSAKREEIQELEEAYETGLRKMRYVKARKQIWPGTVIRILDHEYEVKNPTGPATVALVGEDIQVLPYSEDNPAT